MRLIDADALKQEVRRRLPYGVDEFGYIQAESAERSFLGTIDVQPTIEAEPVIHGRWVFKFELAGSNFYHCSVCDRQEALLAKEDIYEFCPYCHCGAKMDEEEE